MFALLAVGAAGVLLVAGGPRPIAAIWAGVGSLAVVGGVWAARVAKRERLVEHALGATPDRPDTQPVRAPSGGPPPPLAVERLMARKLPKPTKKYRKVSATANVIGGPPLKILHLWVFESYSRLSNYLDGGWREFGSVHLLRQASSVTRDRYVDASRSGRLDQLFAGTTDEVLETIAGFDYRPQPKRFKRLSGFGGASTSTFDRYGSYPVNSLLCHSDVWRYALRALLDRVDIVTMDLSGYTPDNAGTRQEIHELLDTFPMSQIVWLTDPHSDADYLERQLREAWSSVAADSPNRISGNARARLVVTDRVHTSRSDDRMSRDKLVAHRRDARRIIPNLLSA